MASGHSSPTSHPGGKKLKDDPEEDVREGTDSDCAVCLQPCVHPMKLPCGHVFCFLCVKGIALVSRKCAMCRQEIPLDCLEHPDLVKAEELVKAAQPDGRSFNWYYEGRNGWWQYDERTSGELEAAFSKNESELEVLIAGFVYAVDLANMTQRRKNGMGRMRTIKRDVAAIPDKKGVAGLRLPGAGGNASAPPPPPHGAGHAYGLPSMSSDVNRHRTAVESVVAGSQPAPMIEPSSHSLAGSDDEPELSAAPVADLLQGSPRFPTRRGVDCDLDARFGQLRLGSSGSPPPPPRDRRQLNNGDGGEEAADE